MACRGPRTMAPSTGSPPPVCSTPTTHAVLAEAYRFCERTRNRLYLVRGGARRRRCPSSRTSCTWLARSLDTTPAELREHYRRVTRRARTVMERALLRTRLMALEQRSID